MSELDRLFQIEPVTEPGETAEFWLDMGRAEEPDSRGSIVPPLPLANPLSDLFRVANGEVAPIELRQEGRNG